MSENMGFWADSGSFDYESEIAPGHLSRRQRTRAHRKHDIALGIAAIGRNVCFKKDAAPAPAPDPRIGESAVMSAELGREWLDFAKQQHAAGNIRQDQYDALIGKVVNSQLGSQDLANQWAQQDRDIQAGLRDKYLGWADKDRELQLADKTRYDQWSGEDRANQIAMRDKLQNWAQSDRDMGRQTKTEFDALGGRAEALGNQYRGQLDQVAGDFGRRADQQFGFADQQRGRYGNTFQPIEDRIASDAMSWDSDARMATEAGKAKADVIAEAQRQKDANARSMASMGVNPNSGRFAGVSRAADTATALGAAGAMNQARDTVRQQGISLRSQAAQLGQQVLGNANTATGLGMQARGAQQGAQQAAYTTGAAGMDQNIRAKTAGLAAAGVGNTSAGLGAGASGNPYAGAGYSASNPMAAASLGISQQGGGYSGLGVGLNAGQSAIGSFGAGNAAFGANNAIMGQGFSGAMGGYGQQGQIMNSLYGNQLNAWGMQQQANAQQAAGAGQMIGTAIGTGAALY